MSYLSELNPQMEKSKVQRINDDFLRFCTKSEDLSTVHHLCLTSNVIAPYRIMYLENLDGLRNLTVLNASDNYITRLEGLRCLTHLKCLNLNNNRIFCLNGLETLQNLEKLYVNHNMVQDIPSWFQNSLVSLKSLQIDNNKIDNIYNLTKLRCLPNLTELRISNNPFYYPGNTHFDSICSLGLGAVVDQRESVYRQCCRFFLIFYLRSLTLLNGVVVLPADRKEADAWFEKSEISRINDQLELRVSEVSDLSNTLANLSTKSEGYETLVEELSRQRAKQNLKLDEKRRELEVKDELLCSKSDELLRACLKHHEIEQELAFYKMDTKLCSLLGKPPNLNAGGKGSLSQLGAYSMKPKTRNVALDESPYLGKCRYIRLPRETASNSTDTLTVNTGSNTTPRVERLPNNRSNPDTEYSAAFPSFASCSPKPPTLQLSRIGDRSDEDANESTGSADDFLESSEEEEVSQKQGLRLTSTPMKTALTRGSSTLLRNMSAEAGITMPFFVIPSEAEEITEDSWLRGTPSDHTESQLSPNRQKCIPRSTVRIRCDSGIDASNHGSNDIQEESFDDACIDSLPDSNHVENSFRRKDGSTQVSTRHSLLRNSSVAETAKFQPRERIKKRLGNSPYEKFKENMPPRAPVYENDIDMIKKELARLQAEVEGLSTERPRLQSETSSDDPTRHKFPDDVDFVSTCSESYNNKSRCTTPEQNYAGHPLCSPGHPSNHLSYSWNAGDHTEDAMMADLGQARRRVPKTSVSRLPSCLRGTASAVDIRRNLPKPSASRVRHCGKSMELLPGNTPQDINLLYKLQNDLYDLQDRLWYSESENASRLEEAIRHIEKLDNKLRKNSCPTGSPGESRRQNRLSENLEQMRRSRDSNSDSMREAPRFSTDRKGQDLEDVRSSLNAQERELSKLTRVVSQLAHTASAGNNSVGDIAEVSHAIPSGKLICNVTEHHNLEDYLQHVQATADDLRRQLQLKRIKINELSASSLELQTLLKERDSELTHVTNDLVGSKEELLRVNEKLKSIISQRSLHIDQVDDTKAQSNVMESRVAELTNRLSVLRTEVCALEHQRERRKDELEQISGVVERKRSHLAKRSSQIFTGSMAGDGFAAAESSQSISSRSELDQLQPKIAEARTRMETLSREIGVCTAELELLRSKKAQETRLADIQVETSRHELQIILNEISSAKKDLSSIRQERDRIASEVQADRQTSATHLTSDDIPALNRDVSELTRQVQNLQEDIGRHKAEISLLDDQKQMKKGEVTVLEKLLTETKEELTLTQNRRQNADAQLALSRQKSELLKNQLEAFEASVEIKQKLISDLCFSSESRISAMEKDFQRLLSSAHHASSKKSSAKSALDLLKQQLLARSKELQDLQKQFLAPRRKCRNEACSQAVSSQEKLQTLNGAITAQRAGSKSLTLEMCDKQSLVDLQCSSNTSSNFVGTDLRPEELENLLSHRDNEIEVLNGDKAKLLEERTQLFAELTRTRSQLELSRRTCKKLKRRAAKELADLERVAEEQCNRASTSAEELALLRRNYTYLQARIAANEEASDRERCIKEILFSIKTELASFNTNANAIDLVPHLDTIESLINRNTQSPLSDASVSNLKTSKSVPHLPMPPRKDAKNQYKQQHQLYPSQCNSVKNLHLPSSSGFGSSITLQSSSDDRLLNLQEHDRRLLFEHQTNPQIQRLKYEVEVISDTATKATEAHS